MLNYCKCIELGVARQYNVIYRFKGGFDMSSTIQVRVDDDLKVKSDNLFKDLGTNVS